MAERVHKHIKENKIFPLEQKGCRKESYSYRSTFVKQNDYGEYEK